MVDYVTIWGISSRDISWVFAQLHLNLAAFVIAVPTFALIVEIIGFKTGDERYDNLAKDFARLITISLSLTSILGAIFLFVIIVLYPKFFSYFSQIFGGTMVFYAMLFFGEFIAAYLYYYGWDRLKNKKLLHIFIGFFLNSFGIAIMFVANAWVTFMMMPSGVKETGELYSLWEAINNPGWWPLNVHRLIANLAFGGAIVAAYAASNFLSAENEKEREYYDWMGYVGNFIAVSALIPLPFAGYWFGLEIYKYDQQMGITLMGGVLSWLWILQAIIIGVIFLGINYYLWIGMERIEGAERYRKYVPALLLVMTICFIIWFTPHSLVASLEEARKIGATLHPILSVLGIMTAKNTVVNIMILSTFLSFIIYRRSGKIPITSWARLGNFIFFSIIAVVAGYIIFLGIRGYFVETTVRINYSMYQVLAVLFVFIVCTPLDVAIYRKSNVIGSIKWGHMPPRSQYMLIVIAVSFTWLMGLMGFARSSSRLNWHVYKIMEDTSHSAFVPSLGYAAKIVSLITIIFFIMIGVIFFLTKMLEHRQEEKFKFIKE
ncbi:MAG: cytochrome ubiquinol oxidase subunit I [Deltaproteobacteria bacterium]|nr:cytochrome ubiquinol oxidase subunit I [Deltaproteobacteria bacterium]